MAVIWVDVVGWEGLYMVSSAGHVRSQPRRVAQRRWPGSTGRTLRERELKQSTTDDGHKTVALYRDGKRQKRGVHQLVLEAFVGPCPPGMEGCHGNGNPGDNRRENLRWDTQSANVRDAVRHGTHASTRKTHCPREHSLTGANLMPSCLLKGQRTCLACNRALSKLGHRRRAGHTITPELIQAEADAYFHDLSKGF